MGAPTVRSGGGIVALVATRSASRLPLRAALSFGLTALVALVAAAAALGHPALQPASVNVGATARVVVRIPNERRERTTVAFTLAFPAGFTVVRAEDTGDWRGVADGRTATWEGGRIEGESSVDFVLELVARAPTGPYDVQLDQRYDDGRSVTTKAVLSVLPAVGEAAPEQHVGRAILAAAVGVGVVLASLLGLRAVRRRQRAG